MELDRAWHASPAAARAELLREGIVPDHLSGETEVWLLAREEWARAWAEESKGLYRDTREGLADIWLVDLRGLDVHVHEHIRKHPSAVVLGAIDASRLTLLTTVGDGDHIEHAEQRTPACTTRTGHTTERGVAALNREGAGRACTAPTTSVRRGLGGG